jgi:hypothetical protein
MPDRRAIVARYDAGTPLEHFMPDERAELRAALVSTPAYFDPKHEHHSMLVADAARLYAIDCPEEDP